MDEIKTDIAGIQQEQGVPGSSVNLEETPEFKAWSEAKIQEFRAAHNYAWRINIPREKLLMKDDGAGYPDPILQQKAHKFVSANHKFRGSDGEVLVNPATARPMSFMIWQSTLPDPVLAAAE